VDRNAAVVKRRYDASGRRARAERTRQELVSAGRDLLLAQGYAATGVAAIAGACGVSVESVYKRFGGKPGLVRAVVQDALLGDGAVPAETRSDALTASDPVELIRGWGRLTAEVAPRVAPVLLLVRSAAAQDPELAALAEELDGSRRDRMTLNAHRIEGHLRPGLTVERAADVLWSYSSPELYDLLVVRSRWDLDAYAALVVDGLLASLLGHPASDGG
jgi:AcrR family transcriptional regulator